MLCLSSKTDCFLDDPEWTSLLEEDQTFLGPWDRLVSKMSAIYVLLPALIRDISNPAFSSTYRKTLRSRAWNFRERLLSLQVIVQELLSDPEIVSSTASLDPHSPFPTCYRFESLMAAERIWVSWRLIIIADSLVLRLIRNTMDYEHLAPIIAASSLSAADNIFMCGEDGYRWVHICSMSLPLIVPAAIWAYTVHETEENERFRKKDGLNKALRDFTPLMNRSWKTACMAYYDVLGMGCPSHSAFTADDRAVCLWPTGSFNESDSCMTSVECSAC